jgi:hypothetical protein
VSFALRREAAVLLLVAAVAWWPSLDNGYSLDDYNWLAPAHFQSAWAFVGARDGVELRTPVSNAFFWIIEHAAAGRPVAFRAVLLGLHVVTGLLLLVLLRRLDAGADAALAGAALFVGYAAGSEALFWIAAFQHVLATLFALAALLALVLARQGASRAAWSTAVAAFALAVFSKPPYACVILVLATVGLWTPRPAATTARPWMVVAPFAAVLLVAAGLTLPALSHSYLIGRGAYALGPHIVGNLFAYAERLVCPFPLLFERVGLGWARGASAVVMTVVAALLLASGLRRGPAPIRLLASFAVAALLPFLFFTWEPTSRYAYAASAGACGLIGWLLVSARLPRPAGPLVLAGLLLASAFEIRLEDNVYEYRERQSERWIAEVRAAFPHLPRDPRLAVVGLPRIAIDAELHLQAALQLAYADPGLRLVVTDRTPGSPEAFEGILRYAAGRLEPIPAAVRRRR